MGAQLNEMRLLLWEAKRNENRTSEELAAMRAQLLHELQRHDATQIQLMAEQRWHSKTLIELREEEAAHDKTKAELAALEKQERDLPDTLVFGVIIGLLCCLAFLGLLLLCALRQLRKKSFTPVLAIRPDEQLVVGHPVSLPDEDFATGKPVTVSASCRVVSGKVLRVVDPEAGESHATDKAKSFESSGMASNQLASAPEEGFLS